MNWFRDFSLAWKGSSAYRWYWILLLLAWVKQLILPAQLVDATEYLNAASNLSWGMWPDSCSGACDHWLHLTRRTPGYPTLLLIMGMVVPLVSLVQVAMAGLVPVVTNRILKLYGVSARAERWVYLLFLVYPFQYFYSGFVMPEVASQFLLALLIVTLLSEKWLNAGLLAAVLILLKPVFILLIPVLIIFYRPFNKRFGLWIPVLVFVSLSFLNFNKTGVFHFSSIAVENQYEYNMRAVMNVVNTDKEIRSIQKTSDSILAEMDFARAYSYMKNTARERILKHWKLYSWLHIKGTLLSLIDPGRYDLVAYLKLENTGGAMGIKEHGGIQKIWAQPWYLLVYMCLMVIIGATKWTFAAMAGFREFKRYGLLLFVIFTMVVVTGPVGSARYLFPVMPLILALCAAGIVRFFKTDEKNLSAQ